MARTFSFRHIAHPSAWLALTACLLLSGCALTSTAPSVPATIQGSAIQGSVHGGQQPVSGANVYLLAANTTGYGQPSVSLLTTGAGSDSIGYYVQTNSSGVFSITNDYTCTAGQQVYLYASGGNSGSGANSAIGLMAVLGSCPASGNFLASLPLIQVNELTTIAAAYSLSGYATDAIHVSSSGTALAQTGVANAFSNASNLVSIVTGLSLAATPGSVGTPGNIASNAGVVPQAEINTLGNILAACVNTSSAGSAGCTSLLNNAMNGATPPTETASAAINIAHNPGANVAALFALVAGTPPFGGGLVTAPNDWTVAINFTANIAGGQSMMNGLAVDASGNIWLANVNSVIKLSPSGVELSGVSGYYNGGLSYPMAIAIDTLGDAWVGNYTGGTVTEYSSTGTVLSGANGYTVGGNPYSIAIDPSNNVWVANSALLTHSSSVPYSVSELNGTTGANVGASPFTGGGLNTPEGVAIDAAGNAWIANLGGFATEISQTGVVTGYSNPGPLAFINPQSVAIDSSGNKWFADHYGSNSVGYYLTEMIGSGGTFADSTYTASPMPLFQANITIDGSGHVFATTLGSGTNPNYSTWLGEFSSTGTVLSPAGGYHNAGSTCQDASGMAIDGSGNVWVSCGSPSGVMEFIGLATPVVTPLVANLKAPYNAPASKP